ncbi:hypothetical protein BC628DRAFT_1423440 [Trametes gibbosa]|nr:hypothetical protein BC628DRAFT_1423440 [Trametes gibbosa]
MALFLESVLYGAFTVAYGISIWTLLYKRRPSQRVFSRDTVLFAATTLMFALATTHLALDVYIAIKTFLANQYSPGSLANVYEALNDWPTNSIGAAKFAFYVTQTLIGDGFMIYRAFVVWDHMWLVTAVPSFLLFVEVVLGYTTASLGLTAASATQSKACVDAWCIISVLLNVLCSGLIMKRILWPASRPHPESLRTRVKAKSVRRRVMESVIQSAAIYSIASIAFGVTSFLSPDIGFPLCHSLFPPIIGLAFLLIVIRIHRNVSARETSSEGLRNLQEAGERQSDFSVRPMKLSSINETPLRSSFELRCQDLLGGGMVEKPITLSV